MKTFSNSSQPPKFDTIGLELGPVRPFTNTKVCGGGAVVVVWVLVEVVPWWIIVLVTVLTAVLEMEQVHREQC